MLKRLFIAASLAGLLPAATQAAPIVTWSLRDINAATDIKNDGELLKAVRMHPSDAVTVNGITFEPGTIGGTPGGYFGTNIGGQNDASLNELFNSSEYGYSSTTGAYTVTGAVPGQMYRAQFLAHCANYPHPTDIGIDGTIYNNWETNVTTTWDDATQSFVGPAVLLEATWVQEAGDTTVDLAIGALAEPNDVWQFNGFVLQAVPEPASLALLGLGSLTLLRRRRA